MAGFRLYEPREQAPLNHPPYHEWTLPSGRTWSAFHRCLGGFLIRFPGLADFRVNQGTCAASCVPVPGTTEDICHHLYLNQILPLMLGRQGKLVFHASAVVLDRVAVAFVAASGRGKSTLAAAFAGAGHAFLTDDGMALEETDQGFDVLPSHPSIRLRDDSRHALMGDEFDHIGGVSYAAKMRMPAQARLSYCDAARPLGAAYFLGEGEASSISIGPISGAAALEQWIRHAFILDVEDRPGLAAHFAGVSDLAGRVPCYRLDYPHRFEELERVRQTIIDHARAVEGRREPR